MIRSPLAGHPPGLATCFAVELWERFSYYGMRALLIFYLTQHFRFADADAYAIYGAYSGLVYAMPVIGGAIADRWLGARKSVVFGAWLLVAGHLSLAIEGAATAFESSTAMGPNVRQLDLFYLSLALIVTGVGFLKTSASTLVGALYPPGDRRQDAGYTLYYMGANLGAAVSPVLCGWLGHRYGWHFGFGMAGLGMLAGLAMFLRGQHLLAGAAEPPSDAALNETISFGLRRETAIYFAGLLFVIGVWYALRNQFIVGGLLVGMVAAVGVFIVTFAVRHCERDGRRALLGCSILICFSLGFWSFYEQMGSSLNLFADRLVDRVVLGVELPAAMLQALPAVMVIVLSPLLSQMWLRLGARHREPGTPAKFLIALIALASAFFVLAIGIHVTPSGERVALPWFVANFTLLVVGEICLAPVAMSMIARLSPRPIVGVVMGSFMLAYAASSYLAGLIARTAAPMHLPGRDVLDAAPAYAAFFLWMGAAVLAVAVMLLTLLPVLRRWLRES